MKKIKSCKTCLHCIGEDRFAHCTRYGYFCSVAKDETLWGNDFKGWDLKPDSLFVQILKKIFNLK